MTPTPPNSSPGDGVPEPFLPPRVPDHELIRRIGRGAYGEVWLARCALGTYRAVKIVHRRSFDHDRPFEREFEGISKFEPISRRHDSQVDILHVGRGEDYFYYVMELADDQATGGQINPDAYVPRTLKSDLMFRGRIPFEECVHIGVALATALEHLHANGLVHRDVKPSNIIFVNGVAKLADIGLVTGVDATRSYVGTEGFAAPEGAGTPQADLFSLGKVLYEAATGKDRQEFPELPTLLRELPDREGLLELNAVIAGACRHDPKDRYASAAAMRADLELLLSGKSLARLHRTHKQLRYVQRAGAVVTALAALIAAGWLWQVRQTHIVKELAAQKDAASRESRQRLAQLQAANGVRAMDQGDPATAALWFSQVLKNSKGDPAAERRERFRLGMLFRYLPKPIALFHSEYPPKLRLVDDGKQLMAVAQTLRQSEKLFVHSGEIKVWDLASGGLVHFINLTNIWGVNVSESGKWAVVSDPTANRLCKVGDQLQDVGRLPFGGRGERTAFAQDDSKLAICGNKQGRELQICELPSGRPLTPPLVHSNDVTFLAFDPAGHQLVTGTRTGQARVWDAATGEAITDWIHLKEEVGFAAFSPDGKALVVLGRTLVVTSGFTEPHLVTVIDLPSGQLRFPPLANSDQVLCAEFSPDGRFLATGCADHTATIWDAHSGEPVHSGLMHSDGVRQVRFSPDGGWLAAANGRGVSLWDTRSGRLVVPPLMGGDRLRDLLFSPDGNHLVIADASGVIRVWNLAESEPSLSEFRNLDTERYISASFSPDGSRIVTREDVGGLQIWQTKTGCPIGSRMVPELETKDPLGLRGLVATWSFDGRWLASPCGDRTVRIWNALTGEPSPVILRDTNIIDFAEFSPVTNHLLTSAWAGIARVWDAATGQPVTPPLVGGRVARFSLGGRMVATAGGQTARVWDAVTGKPVTPPLQHSADVYAVAFSPDGRMLATAGREGAARIWDARTGQSLSGPMRHLGAVVGVCFSPNSQRLLTASLDNTARVWDVRTGQPVTPPLAHSDFVLAIAFSPDGSKVLTGSSDGTARIWDAITGEPLCMPFRHRKGVLGASFSPDGRWVVTASDDRTAQLWELPELKEDDGAESLAQLYAGEKVSPSGAVEPLDAGQLEALWAQVSHRLAGSAIASSEELIRWHRRRLGAFETFLNLFAAQFHARRLIELESDNVAAAEDLARIERNLPPPRDPATPSELIDLSGCYNASLTTAWHGGGQGHDLAELPRGIQAFAGTQFDVRGLIQVYGPQRVSEFHFPNGFVGIHIHRKLTRLQFLQSSDGAADVAAGTRVGHYLIHFADGHTQELPIIYGRDVREWVTHPDDPQDVPDAVVAWKGNNKQTREDGNDNIQLFKRTWINPTPEVEVTTLDLVDDHPTAGLFLVALTAE